MKTWERWTILHEIRRAVETVFLAGAHVFNPILRVRSIGIAWIQDKVEVVPSMVQGKIFLGGSYRMNDANPFCRGEQAHGGDEGMDGK